MKSKAIKTKSSELNTYVRRQETTVQDNPKIHGGNIDYDLFGNFIDTRVIKTLLRLESIFSFPWDPSGITFDQWPLAFKNFDQADRFLQDLDNEDASWLRISDITARLIGDTTCIGDLGEPDRPLATMKDAARELKYFKEEHFGPDFSYEIYNND